VEEAQRYFGELGHNSDLERLIDIDLEAVQAWVRNSKSAVSKESLEGFLLLSTNFYIESDKAVPSEVDIVSLDTALAGAGLPATSEALDERTRAQFGVLLRYVGAAISVDR
jgi:hypothetical protein